MKTLPVAVQVYSVRDDAERDFKGTMQKIKDMGYDGVELAGLYGMKPAEVKAILEEVGLVPLSAHVPFQELEADIEGTVAQYKEIGMQYIAIPYLMEEDRPGTEKFLKNIETFKKIGEACKKVGITLLYHNHDFEFVKMPNGQYALDYIYTEIPADLLQTELDICWVKVAGEEPVDYIKKYAGRAPVVHLKDFYKEGKPANMYELIGIETEKKEETGKFEFRPVGHGMQNIPPVLDAALEAGSKWVVVEQDQSYDTPALEAVGDVGGIGGAALVVVQSVHNEAHRQSEIAIDLAHPFAVAAGKIVVDGDDMDALAGQRVQVGGQRSHQRLTFAGLHLGDAALMQHDAAHQLDGVGAHPQHTVGGLPHGGKGLRQNVVQRLAVLQTGLELRRLGLQLGVGQRLILVLQRRDLVHDGIDALQLTLAVCSENLGK